MSRRRSLLLLVGALFLLGLVSILNRSPDDRQASARPTPRPALATNTPRPAAQSCQPAPATLLSSIGEGLTVDGGGRLVNGWTVRSNDFQRIHFLAASIVGPGLEDQQTIGVWAINDPANPTIAFGVNGAAVEFSDWADGSKTDARFSMADDGAYDARDCARQAISD